MRMKTVINTIFIVIILGTAIFMAGCGAKATTTTGGPGGGAVINSEGVITATIKALQKESTGYPWSVDILINTTQNVGNLPNPVADKVGTVVSVKTDVDMSRFYVGDNINAHLKYVGDVPKPGITLYLFDVTKQ